MNKTIGLLRLTAQGIADPNAASPAEVVRHLLAMQAQDYTGALWSVGLRMREPSKAAVEQAVRDREIVRTWPMRGTLHFLHADDVHWMVQLLAPRVTASVRNRRINQLGLTDAIVDDAERILRSALQGGKSIIRGDVVTLLRDVKGITIDNQHTQHLMRNFGERGIICFGPHEGKQPTFVLLDEWVPRPAPRTREQTLPELARRYFMSHGPATLKDFAGWGMLKMADAKFSIEAALIDLETSEFDTVTYYHAPGLVPAKTHGALLLPGFDEFLLGYKDRSAVLPAEHAGKIVPGNNGMFLATVVDKGQVVGLWKKKVGTKRITHTYELFDDTDFDATSSEKAYELFLNR